MESLPSGLPEIVADEEDLARFLTSSSQYNSKMVKPSAFLPEPLSCETSVFRHGREPSAALWQMAIHYAAQGRNIHGAAFLKARFVRNAALAVIAAEPPPKHAAIRNWPRVENDRELQRAKQKEVAILLASSAELFKK